MSVCAVCAQPLTRIDGGPLRPRPTLRALAALQLINQEVPVGLP